MKLLTSARAAHSLQRQADQLALALACQRAGLRLRLLRVKQAMVARLRGPCVSPAMLLVALGSGVILEQIGHRRRVSLAGVLNAAIAGGRLLNSLAALAALADGAARAIPAGEVDRGRPG